MGCKKFTNKELDEEIKKAEKLSIKPNYLAADLLREKIKRAGYEVQDTPKGTIIKKIP